jgi:hypothetical protein
MPDAGLVWQDNFQRTIQFLTEIGTAICGQLLQYALSSSLARIAKALNLRVSDLTREI